MRLVLGGDCLADAAVLRAQPDWPGPVAPDLVMISRLTAMQAAEGPRALRSTRKAGWGPDSGPGRWRGPRARRGQVADPR